VSELAKTLRLIDKRVKGECHTYIEELLFTDFLRSNLSLPY